MYKLRRALHEDAQGIIETHRRSIRELCSKDYTEEQIKAWSGRNFKTSIWCQAMDRDMIWVVEVNDKVVGFGHLAFITETSAEILGFYLSPEIKGQGAGKELMETMIQEARKQNRREINLESTITAKSFYERFGFHQYAGDTSIEMQGVPISCFPMKLSLQEN